MVPIVVKRLGKGRRSGSDENAYSRRGSFNVVSCKTVLVGLARFLGVGGLVSVRLTGFAPFSLSKRKRCGCCLHFDLEQNMIVVQ